MILTIQKISTGFHKKDHPDSDNHIEPSWGLSRDTLSHLAPYVEIYGFLCNTLSILKMHQEGEAQNQELWEEENCITH